MEGGYSLWEMRRALNARTGKETSMKGNEEGAQCRTGKEASRKRNGGAAQNPY